MAMDAKPTFLKRVNLFTESNNMAHHTDQITTSKLIVRRGQVFIVSIKINEAFDPRISQLTITAQTGEQPSQDLGTMSSFSIPPKDGPPPSNVVWTGSLMTSSLLRWGMLTVFIMPPANCPIGKYRLLVKYKGEETHLADLVVLFNPWCPEDAVYLPFERKKKEYVLNEQGVIFRGSTEYIMSLDWDFGQFEEDMVDIGMAILDNSLSYQENPLQDVASRRDPVHVSRVISAMVNSNDDQGILVGNWSGYYDDGYSPTHWNGSHAILRKWYMSGCKEVKYGQCWVFAGVMCSVMRLLGIPCRVITNFVSAHDVDKNLTIDMYHSFNGIEDRPSPDSIWNFHVWVECWFTRPDLSVTGEYDGWQVLDPTPQETSGGIFCCGPASVKAIKNGETDQSFDVPFIFAEVNADCVDWLVLGEDESVILKLDSDTKKVGQNISTKSLGSKHRRDITGNYKFKEGTLIERKVFKHAITRDYTRVDEWDNFDEEDTDDEIDDPVDSMYDEAPPPEVSLRFEEETQPINGRDVSMILVVQSESSVSRDLTINVSVQAMRYNGVPLVNIQNNKVFKTLLPGQEFYLPIVVPYSVYHTHMLKSESMKISAIVSEKDVPEHTYLADCDVVLLEPEITVNVTGMVQLHRRSKVEITFENPIEERLRNCSMMVSGSGLFLEDFECQLPDLMPDNRIRVEVYFIPYKVGEKSLLVDFDCSEFRDLKASAAITVIT